MGYGSRFFSDVVAGWFAAGWLAPGDCLIDFGSQELTDTPELSVRSRYEELGIGYESVDVDEQRGARYLDLNRDDAPAEWLGHFDFVNNEGTIEHLANPINAFRVAHDLAKAGGVMRHSFPLIGWREHGFFYATTKFYAELVGANEYRVLRARASMTSRTPFICPLFGKALDGDGRPITMSVVDIWGELVCRKVEDAPFVLPIDHVGGPNAKAAKARMRKAEDGSLIRMCC